LPSRRGLVRRTPRSSIPPVAPAAARDAVQARFRPARALRRCLFCHRRTPQPVGRSVRWHRQTWPRYLPQGTAPRGRPQPNQAHRARSVSPTAVALQRRPRRGRSCRTQTCSQRRSPAIRRSALRQDSPAPVWHRFGTRPGALTAAPKPGGKPTPAARAPRRSRSLRRFNHSSPTQWITSGSSSCCRWPRCSS